MPPLTYKKLWLGIGWGIIFSIAAVSLYPLPPLPILQNGMDKVWHATAYAGVMFWFVQIYRDKPTRWLLALAFILMGGAIEIAQGFSIIRTFDLADALANATGVVLSLMLAHTRLANGLHWLETTLKGNQ